MAHSIGAQRAKYRPSRRFIKSVQPFEITIGNGSTSNTQTILAVDTSRSVIFLNGYTTTESSSTFRLFQPRAELTNATTVTVNRDTSSTSTVTVRGVVVEFTSRAVVAVQAGTITIANGATSGTATITSVLTASSVVLYLGHTITTTTTSPQVAHARVDLTNATTVTATRGSSGTSVLTVGYAVIQFVPAVIRSTTQQATTLTSGSNSDTDTISAVNTANTLLLYNGVSSTSTSIVVFLYRLELTNSTTVTLTRVSTSSTTRTIAYTILELVPGIINSLQRNSTAIASTTSADATITPVNTGIAFCKFNHFSTNASTTDERQSSVKLQSATTVRCEKGTGGSSTATAAWEVVEVL